MCSDLSSCRLYGLIFFLKFHHQCSVCILCFPIRAAYQMHFNIFYYFAVLTTVFGLKHSTVVIPQ